jgi:Uma2 family endonuclease
MTPREIDALPARNRDKGDREELINGVLAVSPPVNQAEVDPKEELGRLLRNDGDSEQGRHLNVTLSEPKVPTTANHRRCDRVIRTGLGRLPDLDKDIPAIVVDFVSESKRDAIRDEEHKRDESLAAGVVERRIIDRFQRTMTAFTRGALGRTHQIVTERQTYTTKLLPGFERPLARPLAKADRWEPKRSPKRKKGDS